MPDFQIGTKTRNYQVGPQTFDKLLKKNNGAYNLNLIERVIVLYTASLKNN